MGTGSKSVVAVDLVHGALGPFAKRTVASLGLDAREVKGSGIAPEAQLDRGRAVPAQLLVALQSLGEVCSVCTLVRCA